MFVFDDVALMTILNWMNAEVLLQLIAFGVCEKQRGVGRLEANYSQIIEQL